MVAPNFIYDIRKVPSYLLGLAETRARADGQVLRIEQAMAELQTELAKARTTRASCDALIERYDSILDAAAIAPVKAWKGRYGERGALLGEIKRVVREAYPGSVTALDIADHLIRKFKLEFPSPKDERDWRREAVNNKLRILRSRDVVVRVDEPDPARRRPAQWQWVVREALPLSSLAEQARALGLQVEEASEEDDHDPRNHAEDSQLPQGAG
jgi:hypothetical protein